MADTVKTSQTGTLTFTLTEDQGGSSVDVASRSITFDAPWMGAGGAVETAGMSAVKLFGNVMTGAASSPFETINATHFLQRSGWRDEDIAEDELITSNYSLTLTTQIKTYVDLSAG